MNFSAMGIIRAFTKPRRKPRRMVSHLQRHYPRVYTVLALEIARGRCPVCGRPVKARGFGAHVAHSERCKREWGWIASSMLGDDRLSEEEVMRLIDELRVEKGLEPLFASGSVASRL